MPNLRVGAGHDPPVGAAEAAAAKRERMTVVSCMVGCYIIGMEWLDVVEVLFRLEMRKFDLMML